jgi:hypothetical protein
MTLLKPNLQLRKLRVMRGAQEAYSADFHEGVNIIRGQNASGKSTVMDFIFYVLGGENIPWKNEALLCSDVLAEISANGAPATLRRPVNDNPRNPLSIFWGDLVEAQAAPYTAWETYPYQRSQSKESFSQILFRMLELPELRGEGASNITMHQLLRLLYVDQRTPHDEIFRSESFDQMLTRETVGNYLCGIYSGDLYDAQIELKAVESRLERSVSDLRNLFAVLGKSGQGGASTLDFLRAEKASTLDEIARLNQTLVELRKDARAAKEGSATAINRLRAELSDVQQRFANAKTQQTELQLEIEDSKQFIVELERRLESLDQSAATRSYLGAVRFNFCPCCLTKLEDAAESTAACQLCKSPIEKTPGHSQLLRMRNELSLQRRESGTLLEARLEKYRELNQKVPPLEAELLKLESVFRSTAAEWISPAERQAETINIRIGELKQRLVQLSEYERLAAVIEDLQSKRAELEQRKRELLDLITKIEHQDEETKAIAKLKVAEALITLLKSDLPRQDEFISASAVNWNFGQNRVSVNGHTQFSESSMVVLKHSFHFALLIASTQIPAFRVPRFLLLDGIEDGGQETARSHNLQELIVRVSKSLPSTHQVIFATSQIAPSLAGTAFVVGKDSNATSKTLAIL